MNATGYAVDLGGTKTAAARLENNVVVSRVQHRTDVDQGMCGQINAIAEMLTQLGHRFGDPLGVAVSGRLDVSGGWHAINRSTLSSITEAPLVPALCERFGPATKAANDAAAAAYAEALLGAGRGARNFGYLTVSTGVGGGLVLNGRLINSSNGLAGHVGFCSSRFGDQVCGSGRFGTVESVAGGRAIAEAAGLEDARAVFSNARFEPVVDRSAAAIAALLGDLTAILGLDRVAIGGSIGLASGYLNRVFCHLADEPELFRPAVMPAELGHDSGMVGALLLANSSRH